MADELLLTPEEFVGAQMDYIEREKERTGSYLSFPLGGESRDDCNRKAQLAKDQTHYEAKIKEAVSQERERIINLLCLKDITIYSETKDVWKELRGQMGDDDAKDLADQLLALHELPEKPPVLSDEECHLSRCNAMLDYKRDMDTWIHSPDISSPPQVEPYLQEADRKAQLDADWEYIEKHYKEVQR